MNLNSTRSFKHLKKFIRTDRVESAWSILRSVMLSALICLVALTSYGCLNDSGEPGGDTSTGSYDDMIKIIENGAANYKIIRSEYAGPSVTGAALMLREAAEVRFEVKLTLFSDWTDGVKKGQFTVENNECEILIGQTNRTLSDPSLYGFTTTEDFIIKVSGNKIVILGSSDSATARAVEYFISLAVNGSQSAGVMEIGKDFEHKVFLMAEGLALREISEQFKIVYKEGTYNRMSDAAAELQTLLSGLCGTTVPIRSDLVLASARDREIIIGQTNRSSPIYGRMGELGYYDYIIRADKDKIVILGGSALGTCRGVVGFFDLLLSGGLPALSDGCFDQVFTFPEESYNPITSDISSFVPVWAGEWTPPSWLVNFSEKLYAITNLSGRQMSVSHRGDKVNYPEDSLEGYASAILAGADVLEVDVQLTKDYIIVIMHNETLNKTTNFSAMAGKNGLPSSNQLSDWTYAELRQLSLKNADGTVSPYKIPTFYELLMIANGRCFLALDCKDDFDAYYDIMPVGEEIGACECFFYTVFLSGANMHGYSVSSLMKKWTGEHLENTELQGYYSLWTSYLSLSGHKIRARCWAYDANTNDPESEALYEVCYKDGKTLLYSNFIIQLQKYIAKTYSPDKTTS